jgi:hypothetical protein
MVILSIAALAWWLITAHQAKVQAEAGTEAILALMKGISTAEQSSYDQVPVDPGQAGSAHSAVGKFNLHTFTTKLMQLDPSDCPADFSTAYEQWLKAVQASEAYSNTNNVVDAQALFHGNGDARSLAIVDQLKQTQSNLRASAQRYGVVVRDK